MTNQDPFNLNRFLSAQEDCYTDAIRELRSGMKIGHWMWYIFPQCHGLGNSSTSQFYAISSLGEAAAYLCHPVLGGRLISCAEAVLGLPTADPETIFGPIDSLKFRSSMTLFELVSDGYEQFSKALDMLFGGSRDHRTIDLCSDDRAS